MHEEDYGILTVLPPNADPLFDAADPPEELFVDALLWIDRGCTRDHGMSIPAVAEACDDCSQEQHQRGHDRDFCTPPDRPHVIPELRRKRRGLSCGDDILFKDMRNEWIDPQFA